MSNVTNVLIFIESMADLSTITEPPRFSSHPALAEQERFVCLDYEVPGGYKYIDADIYACAFNYVTYAQLEEWFDNLPWYPTDVAVMVMSNEDGGIRIKRHAENADEIVVV